MKFSEGDLILARSPTSDEFERATVVNIKGSKYKVKFEGGSEHTLGESDVKARRTSRSQTRSKSRGGKSPARSPGRRSPGRKSPARAPNSQSRKLPLRQPKQAKISIARLEIPKDNSSDTDRTEGSESLKDEFVEPNKRLKNDFGPITRRSIRIMSNISKAEHEQKLASLKGDADRSVSLPAEKKYYGSTAKQRGLSMQPGDDISKLVSDEEGEDSTDKHKKIDLISKPQEWGGWSGSLMMILFTPTYALLMQLLCMYADCQRTNIYALLEKKYTWKSFFDLHAFLAYAGFLSFIAIMSALPIGRRVDGLQTKTGCLQYRINGIWTFFIIMAAFFGLQHEGYNVHHFIVEKVVPLTVAGLIFGIILAIALYIKASRVPVANLNIYACTSSKIFNFWQGKEVNPRIGPIDIKIVLYRSAMIGTIIVNLAMLLKFLDSKHVGNVEFIPITVVALQSIYALDSLIFEASFLTTFEVLYEGTGYMLSVGYLIYPFLASLTIRNAVHNKPPIPIYVQYFLIACFFVGYLIYRLSNREKDIFRRNPFDSFVSHLESIPTRRGTRLIVSGWWGHVRHPNYLGDLIMHWSIAILGFSTLTPLPYILALQTTLLLFYRDLRNDARCRERYGYAWEQYCSRVKYRFIKRIY